MSDYFLLQEADQSLDTSHNLAEPSYRMLYLMSKLWKKQKKKFYYQW